ncbi:hypothetical protein MTO96_030074, partial [Rhipicephalus appendiculatus]
MVTIQRVALLAIQGLQVLLHAAPIDLELERRNGRVSTICASSPTLPLAPCGSGLGGWPYRTGNIFAHPSLNAIPTFRRLSRPQALVALRARAVHVFTDGSYTSRAAGAAYVAFDVRYTVIHVGRFRLRRVTSAYDTEVLGFKEALKDVLAARYAFPIALYTDCLSLLQAVTSSRNTEPQ